MAHRSRCEGRPSARRAHALAAKGARPQRLLWASTTPKDAGYPDVYYGDALVGPDTIDTMTPDILRAYLDRGHPAAHLGTDVALACDQIGGLA